MSQDGKRNRGAGIRPAFGGEPEVLIVGGGPVGLVLGCELLQQGVGVRVVERRPSPRGSAGLHSRAILIWPRILEQLRRVGVSERLVEAGHVLPSVDYFAEGRPRGSVRMDRLPDTPYPFVLTLAQGETEEILRSRLTELGGVVEYETALEGLEHGTAGDDRPKVRLRRADGTEETVVPQYLVGADGAGSTLRELLGIAFDPEPIDVSYAIGDFAISGGVPHSVQYYYSPNGIAVVVPLKNGLYRLAGNVPHRGEEAGPPTLELFQNMLRQRARLSVRLAEPLWTSSFRPRCGVVHQYRSGRCFLAGDAAHVVSPAGGQGMNLGLQDAVNLGWKLGGVLRGQLDHSILNTYHPERSAAAERVGRAAATQIRYGTVRGAFKVGLRDNLFHASHYAGVLQRGMAPLLAQTDFTYGRQPLGVTGWGVRRPAQEGDRLPLFAGPAALAGLPVLDLEQYTVLLWPGRRADRDWAAEAAVLRQRLADLAPVHDLSTVFGRAHTWLLDALGSAPALAVVRPDGHLALRTGPGRPEQVAAFLAEQRPGAALLRGELAARPADAALLT
ncbi:FAD-dependent monooxygenase [Kitasatospora albolonga]|uniref:FAD-dependent monooxygenase n=1 Tax=Kitasatospora albolonga TaxID=68173 RepID=UPI0031EA5EC4